MNWIYLDNNATTRPDPRVVEAMLPFLGDQYANPSSVHLFGQQVRHAVETAREQVAGALGAKPRQIVFTGGGSEANTLAIRGTLASRPNKRHFITTAVEHDSVLRLAGQLEKEGYRVTYLGVDPLGRLDLAELEAALADDTALVSVMHANNETGVIFPIERIGQLTAARGVPLHVDATQTVGKLPVDTGKLPVQLLTLAAHKFHGPKGVGAVYVGKGVRLRPQVLGGHQERDLRAGTENVPGIVGTGAAIQLAVTHLEEENTRVRALRDRLEAGLLERIAIAHVNGDRTQRLPNTINIGFEALEAEAVLMLLSKEGICVSSGSACSSGSLEPSHVLQAMGIDPRIAHGAVRFSLSRFTTDEEITRTLEIVPRAIERLQSLQPREVPGAAALSPRGLATP
ncbi:MAG TPA: cysteine desulfurase NifS [Phycisphaerae bacterium]|jgi:cysteine desulfurase|nr:cysteine desulfurase NifS [Phycisphaerae bacterium]HOB75375.1 cysteine desulfurase NifS [Phycisphaerae bacterium]HOJ55953.1 cysteine desulfurase NifS [Phycisphaerae bacterium]HOL26707.1 cysteine desulfurase NifS [Phycisphaerae bacterium]HPP20544.1 cysteine desulfurase NifS [Phycisphaerae bacterium]